VLLLDENDALFSKYAEVKDIHDRYVNTEVSYLLQRMERFNDRPILTTNLKNGRGRIRLSDPYPRLSVTLMAFSIPEVPVPVVVAVPSVVSPKYVPCVKVRKALVPP